MTTYLETFELDADPERVFAALLDGETLIAWLAENVQIEARKGGAYRFWGPDVIWCATDEESEGEILELDEPNTLVVSWRWKGHATRVLFQIEKRKEAGSSLCIEQRFETHDPGSDGPGPDMAGCHWRIAIGNFRSVLETGQSALRADYTALTHEGTPKVELEIDIDAPPERVFQALLDPKEVGVWMEAESAEIDPDTNRYSYGWHRGDAAVEVGPTQILELVPNRLLVHDWQWLDEPDGQVRWELTPIASGTRLRLVHVRSSDVTNSLGWSDAMIGIRRLSESS